MCITSEAETVPSQRNSICSAVSELRDQDLWALLDGEELLQLLHRGLSAYGATNDESLVRLLMPVYMHAMETTDTAARFETYSAIKHEVEQGYVSMNALLPFLLVDQDTTIVSSATVDIAMIGRPATNDGLAWPRTIVSYLQQGMGENRGAVFGGLVSLGDRRVNTLLDEVKWTLTDTEVNAALRCWTGFPTLAAFEFWLNWLEELMGKGQGESAVYGTCASALPLILERTHVEYIADIERNFGYMHAGDNMPSMHINGWLSVSEVGARFAERLYALEAREQPPKLISYVLTRYGLVPRALVKDRYMVQ